MFFLKSTQTSSGAHLAPVTMSTGSSLPRQYSDWRMMVIIPVIRRQHFCLVKYLNSPICRRGVLHSFTWTLEGNRGNYTTTFLMFLSASCVPHVWCIWRMCQLFLVQGARWITLYTNDLPGRRVLYWRILAKCLPGHCVICPTTRVSGHLTFWVILIVHTHHLAACEG